MTIPATDTAIDIAYWFFNRAEKDGIYLETEKMQHLLFLAQIHFAMAYNMQIAFATTVVGLVAGAVGFLTQQVKQRWYLQDMTNLEFISELLNDKRSINKTTEK